MDKILIPQDIAEVGKAYLRERGYELKVGVPVDIESLKREVADADGLIVRNARYPREVLEAGTKLKVVARHGTGVDNIDLEAATELGIQVTNAPVSNINAVAEYTVALIMALGCHLRVVDGRTRRKDWSYRDKMPSRRREIKGSVLGIVGFGRIGRMVAEKVMNGLGMQVIVYDPRAMPMEHPRLTVVDALDALLEQAGFVTVHVPSTPETKDLFGLEAFKKMKRSACFINCARGDVYVEADLCQALEEGLIQGAALDVYREEPLSPESRLFEQENLLLSQHNASLSKESTDDMALHAAIGVDEVLRGEPPTWAVNDLTAH